MWSFTEFRRARTTLLRRTLVDYRSRWTLSFPNFFSSQVFEDNFSVRFDPNFPSFRRTDFSRMGIFRHTIQLYRLLQLSNWSFRTTFLWFFAGLLTCLNMSKRTLVAITCILSESYSFDIREDANNYMTDYYNCCIGTKFCACCLKSFHPCCLNLWGFFSLSVSLGLRIWCGQGRLSISSVNPATVSSGQCMIETTRVSFRTFSMCFPLKTLSHFPLNGGFLSFSTLGHCSSLYNFVPDSEASSSHRLIKMKSHRCLQSWITRLSIVSYSFLVVQSQDSLKLNRMLLFWLEKSFQDDFRRNFACC